MLRFTRSPKRVQTEATYEEIERINRATPTDELTSNERNVTENEEITNMLNSDGEPTKMDLMDLTDTENGFNEDKDKVSEAEQALYVVHDVSSANGDVVLGLVGRSNSVSPSVNGKEDLKHENMENYPQSHDYCDIRSDKLIYSAIEDSMADPPKTVPSHHDVMPNGDIYSVPHHVQRPRRPPQPPSGSSGRLRRPRRPLPGFKTSSLNSFPPHDPNYKKYRAALRSTPAKKKRPARIKGGLKKDKKNGLKVSFRDDASIIQAKKKSKCHEFKRHQPLHPGIRNNACDSDDNLSIASEDSDASISEFQPRRLRIRRTIAQMFAWVAMGLFTETIGPNMAYLMSRVNCTYGEISHPMMTRGGFMFLGAALAGILCEVLPHLTDLWLATSLVLGSGGIAAAPWCEDLLYLNLALGATGLARGLLVVASLSYGSQVWTENVYHLVAFLLHFSYAIGASAAPQLTYLFESGIMDKILGLQENGTLSGSLNGHHEANYTTPPSVIGFQLPREMYSFDIIAVFCFLVGAAFLALLGTSLANITSLSPELEERIRERKAQNLKPISWFVGHELPGWKIIFFAMVFCALPLVNITILGRWLVEITHNALGTTSFWDRPMCLLLQTIFWSACALGLVITPILRRCLPPNGLMITFTTMSLIAAALLCVYFHKFVIFVWIFIGLLGAFSSPLIPMGYSYCNIFVSQTPIGIALLTCFSSLAEVLASWQASFLFNHFRPATLLFLAAAASCLIFICYLPIIPSLIRRQWRPPSTDTKKTLYSKSPQV